MRRRQEVVARDAPELHRPARHRRRLSADGGTAEASAHHSHACLRLHRRRRDPAAAADHRWLYALGARRGVSAVSWARRKGALGAPPERQDGRASTFCGMAPGPSSEMTTCAGWRWLSHQQVWPPSATCGFSSFRDEPGYRSAYPGHTCCGGRSPWWSDTRRRDAADV